MVEYIDAENWVREELKHICDEDGGLNPESFYNRIQASTGNVAEIFAIPEYLVKAIKAD